jgi:hypothetical protein
VPASKTLKRVFTNFAHDEWDVLLKTRANTGVPIATVIRRALAAYLGDPRFLRDLRQVERPAAAAQSQALTPRRSPSARRRSTGSDGPSHSASS